MPVNSTHPTYDANLDSWQRIRDVLAGDAAIKRGADKYVPRLDSQNDDEFQAYIDRGFFYTATARTVSGFDKSAQLRIGSTTAWVTDTLGATAGYLEFKGDGLMTFERALDRVERLLTVLGSRLLESQKRVSESAEAFAAP